MAEALSGSVTSSSDVAAAAAASDHTTG